MNIAGKVIEVLFCCFVTQWNVFCTLGVCLGFSIMEQVESVNVPFTILRTRFRQCKFRFCLALVWLIICEFVVRNHLCAPHLGPKTVIYDNACQLQTYCLLQVLLERLGFLWIVCTGATTQVICSAFYTGYLPFYIANASQWNCCVFYLFKGVTLDTIWTAILSSRK